MPQNPLTLTRQQLYDLVWSKPVRDVAKEFGMSDVALAKRCHAVAVPVPPRGYWAQVAAGQKPRKTPLPKFRTRSQADPSANPARGAQARAADTSAASLSDKFHAYVRTHDRNGKLPEPVISFDPADTRAQAQPIATPLADAPHIMAITDLAAAINIVKRTARHYKHPHARDFRLPHGAAAGPIVHLNVSPDSLDRALKFADTFLRAAAEQNWHPIPPPEPEKPNPDHYYRRVPERTSNPGPHYADLDVNGKRIEFCIEERCELRTLPPTATELARQKRDPYFRPRVRTETDWSGALRLRRARPGYRYHINAKSWFDTRGRTVETLIPRILADIQAVAAHMAEVDDRMEREQRARDEAARLQKELEERRAANQELIHELERQAGAWHRAQCLRRYLRAARRAAGISPIQVSLNDQPTDFLAWAEHYINQLDPLTAEPRDSDLRTPQSNYYYGPDEKELRKDISRIIGHEWQRASLLLEVRNVPADEGGDGP